MRTTLRVALAASAVSLFAAGCARETAPTATDFANLALLAPDATVGATQGQASLPGFTMSPDPTFQGTMDGSASCAFSASSGRVECTPVTREGLTITRSYAFYNAAGTAQSRRDSLTRSANTQVTVKGTTTTPRGTVTVDRSSSVTVSGLAKDTPAHTINGTETGTATASISTNRGAGVSTEQFTATTTNVVVPAPFSATSWPRSGTTTRQSTLTVSLGGTTRTSTSTEQATYNGTSVIPVVFTRDGTSRTCSRDLAAHTTSCR